MDRLELERQRGQFARDLLDNPVYKDTWTAYESRILEQLKACNPRDAEGLQKAVMLLQIMAKFREAVEQTIETGKMATIQLERLSIKQRVQEWIGRDGLTV